MNLKKSNTGKEEERENFHTAVQMPDPGLGGQPQGPAQHPPAHVGILRHSRPRCQPLPYRGRVSERPVGHTGAEMTLCL